MDLSEITPLILTFNEEPNIERCLKHLSWAKHIIVVDSGSNDATLSIIDQTPNAEHHFRKFDNHPAQWAFGLSLIKTPWALTLDADYMLTHGLLKELEALTPTCDGYYTRFKYCINGLPLRRSLLPPRLTLFRKDKGQFIDDGHTQKASVQGTVGSLSGYLFHDDRKSLRRWLTSQDHYATLEANKLSATPSEALSFADRLRKLCVITPIIVPLYCLFVKGVILDGWKGLHYTWQRTLAEIILSLKLIEKRF